jgi:SAM-dependent methyltransferase
MNMDEASSNWTKLGKDDPMWVVLTDPDKKGNRWDAKEFFATGESAIAMIFDRMQGAGLVPSPGRALDFGCGVGRLTQALAAHFDAVDGVDISSSMINHAETFNRFAGRVQYHLNVRPDLATFPSSRYDFICSLIALQHIPARFQRGYLRDFLRLLKPGGVAYFQTVHATFLRGLVPEWAADLIRSWRSHGEAFIPLYGLPIGDVRRTFNRPGSRIAKEESAGYEGWQSRYTTDTFIVAKTAI